MSKQLKLFPDVEKKGGIKQNDQSGLESEKFTYKGKEFTAVVFMRAKRKQINEMKTILKDIDEKKV